MLTLYCSPDRYPRAGVLSACTQTLNHLALNASSADKSILANATPSELTANADEMQSPS